MNRTVITALLVASFGIAHAAGPVLSAVDYPERSPLNIVVNGQNGTTFRLVYSSGSGWSFAAQPGLKVAVAESRKGAAGPIQALPTDTPQSVFVDGPSGYVFVYVIDEGWRFVGNVADTKR